MGKTFGEMTEEIRAVNTALGWRNGTSTFGDLVALVHTEVAEATSAFRRYRLADATENVCGRAALEGLGVCPEHGPNKPEGVGSELADVLIRLIDLGDIFGFTVFERDLELADVAPIDMNTVDWPELIDTFGEYTSWLHRCVGDVMNRRVTPHAVPYAIRALVTIAEQFNVDLAFQYERKIAYNRHRDFQHGGTMSGPLTTVQN